MGSPRPGTPSGMGWSTDEGRAVAFQFGAAHPFDVPQLFEAGGRRRAMWDSCRLVAIT